MAMITGKVQVYESPNTTDLEVGQPFARKQDEHWVTLEGKNLKPRKVEVKDLEEKVKKRKA